MSPFKSPEQNVPKTIPPPTEEEMDRMHAEALAVNEELDTVLAQGKYTKVQETADTIIRKQDLARNFREEMQRALAELPEGQKPTLALNEKGIANMYMANHLFGKDFTMRHIAECLAKGEEVTDKMKHGAEGSRYFRLNIPEGAGMPGRFVLPHESGTQLAEHVANWNQSCEFKFRHGNLSPIVKKRDLPQWLIDYESSFYVIVEKNQLPDGKLQVADGPTDNDPEESWLISTVHYGQPSRIKPRPPREPKWDKLKGDPQAMMEALAQYQKAQSKYLADHDAWSDEQRRVVFVDLEEEGVGQKGVKEGPKTQEEFNDQSSKKMAELEQDNAALKKMLMEALGEIKRVDAEVKGLKTRQKSQKG